MRSSAQYASAVPTARPLRDRARATRRAASEEPRVVWRERCGSSRLHARAALTRVSTPRASQDVIGRGPRRSARRFRAVEGRRRGIVRFVRRTEPKAKRGESAPEDDARDHPESDGRSHSDAHLCSVDPSRGPPSSRSERWAGGRFSAPPSSPSARIASIGYKIRTARMPYPHKQLYPNRLPIRRHRTPTGRAPRRGPESRLPGVEIRDTRPDFGQGTAENPTAPVAHGSRAPYLGRTPSLLFGL